MLALLEALFAAGAPGATGAPKLTGPVSLSSYAGTCSPVFTTATLSVGWSVTNPDNAAYEIRVLENGALVLTTLTTASGYLKTIEGYIEGGPYHRFTANWTYTVQLVRKADGVVVDTKTSSAWGKTYGTCTLAV